MKHFYLLFALLLTGAALSAQTVRYVDADATGTGDGTRWANAYTSLAEALADTTADQIWVAAGTYTPGTDTLDAFVINRQVDLYGGFAGTETTVLESNPAVNVTILSGDLAGDDEPGDTTTNRGDNALHVIYIDSLILNPVIIDGFTISGGFAGDFNPDSTSFWYRGAGIYAFSAVAINDCIFTDNRASGGSAVYVVGEDADGSSITDSEFHNNYALDAGIVFFNSVIGALIDNSHFHDNVTDFGTLLVNNSAVVAIENSTFDDNVNPISEGGGIYLLNSVGIVLRNDTLSNNTAATNGAGLTVRMAQLFRDPELLEIDGCVFQDNTSLWGGGAFISNISATITGTTFLGNTASTGLGGGLYTQGDSMTYIIDNSVFQDNVGARGGGVVFRDSTSIGIVTNTDFINNSTVGSAAFGGGVYMQTLSSANFTNCLFDGNIAPVIGGAICLLGNRVINIDSSTFSNNAGGSSGGGAMYIQTGGAQPDSIPTTVNIYNTTFEANETPQRGGALYCGFGSPLTVINSSFQANTAGTLGGGLYTQNDGTPVYFAGTSFEGNRANTSGGAIMSLGNSTVVIDSCQFQGNQATAQGGALDFRLAGGTTEYPSDTVIVDQSTFTLNLVDGDGAQAAAILVSDMDMLIVNSVIASSIVNDDAVNGPISLNASGIDGALVDMNVWIVNSTIVDNLGTVIAGVAAWEDPDANQDSVSLTVTLTNNLISNPAGPNVAVEDGEPTFVSGGGNLITDNSFDDHAVESDIINPDLTSADLLTNPGELDFTVIEGSALIDAGVTGEFVPEVDIEGTPRDETPDIGAYEFSVSSVDEEVIGNAGQLKVLPNPVHLDANIQLTNDWTGQLQVRLYDLNGRIMHQSTVTKAAQQQLFPVNVSLLPAGQYFVLVSNGEQAVVEKLIKR